MRTVDVNELSKNKGNFIFTKELKVVGKASSSCSNLFRSLRCEILDITELDTSDVEDMRFMFGLNLKLKEIKGLENLDVSKVKDMSSLFTACEKLESVDLSSWSTNNLDNMEYMFCGCFNLKEIKGLENLDVSKVKNMDYSFGGCESLESLDISNWRTNNLEAMEYMFYKCRNLKEIKGVENLNISDKNRSTNDIFKDCPMEEVVNNTIENVDIER